MQHVLYIVVRPDSQFVYMCVRFVIFCGLRFSHILKTCSHMHLTAPCSIHALDQDCPTMSCIRLVLSADFRTSFFFEGEVPGSWMSLLYSYMGHPYLLIAMHGVFGHSKRANLFLLWLFFGTVTDVSAYPNYLMLVGSNDSCSLYTLL